MSIATNMREELKAKLSAAIQQGLATRDCEALENLLAEVADSLNISRSLLAAGLLTLDDALLNFCRSLLPPIPAQISQPQATATNLVPSADSSLTQQLVEQFASALQIAELQPEKQKMVRYRIEIGRAHEISDEEIKTVLINESGVDRTKIGYLEIRNTYSLIDLPPGMPPDIFQLLQTVEIKQQALQIKRVNASRKRPWQRRKNNGAKANKSQVNNTSGNNKQNG